MMVTLVLNRGSIKQLANYMSKLIQRFKVHELALQGETWRMTFDTRHKRDYNSAAEQQHVGDNGAATATATAAAAAAASSSSTLFPPEMKYYCCCRRCYMCVCASAKRVRLYCIVSFCAGYKFDIKKEIHSGRNSRGAALTQLFAYY